MRRCAEVERGLIGVFIQLAQLRHDIEHDIRCAERNVREDKGQVALVQTDGGEQQHERYAMMVSEEDIGMLLTVR